MDRVRTLMRHSLPFLLSTMLIGVLGLAGCQQRDATGAAANAPAGTQQVTPPPGTKANPAVRKPNYYSKTDDGGYLYAAGLSPDEQAAGQAGGDLIRIYYLGRDADGDYYVTTPGAEGIRAISHCHPPCKVVQVANVVGADYGPESDMMANGSIAGVVFSDAMHGFLEPSSKYRTADAALARKALANKSYKRAFDLMSLAASEGDVRAMVGVATLYEQGRGTAKDDKKALAWYEQAANHGNVGAMMTLAQKGVERGLYKGAFNMWKAAAKHGSPLAAVLLHVAHRPFGHINTRAFKQRVEYMERAWRFAQNGSRAEWDFLVGLAYLGIRSNLVYKPSDSAAPADIFFSLDDKGNLADVSNAETLRPSRKRGIALLKRVANSDDSLASGIAAWTLGRAYLRSHSDDSRELACEYMTMGAQDLDTAEFNELYRSADRVLAQTGCTSPTENR